MVDTMKLIVTLMIIHSYCLLTLGSVIQSRSVDASNDTESVQHQKSLTAESLECTQGLRPEVCAAGRRMYKLLSYESNSTTALSECRTACNESYTSEVDRTVCQRGCLSAVNAVADTKNQLAEYEMSGYDLIRRAQMQQMMSHWMFELIAGFDMFNDWYDSGNTKSDDEGTSYVVVEHLNNQLRITSYRVQRLRPAGSASSPADNESESGPFNPYADSREEEFESCLRRAHYSRWVVCLLVFCSALFLIWLAGSSITTAPKHQVRKSTDLPQLYPDEKLSMKMKLSYPDDGPAPVHAAKKAESEDVKMLLA